MTAKDVFILALNVERVRDIRPRTLHTATSAGLTHEARTQLKRDELAMRTGALGDRTTRG